MSTAVRPISGHPTLRISRLVELLVVRRRLAQLDELCTHLPLDDPDRHALDRTDIACAALATGEPDSDLVTAQRRSALLKAIEAEGGRWKSGHAIHLYKRLGYGHVGTYRAAGDLKALRIEGHLVQHDADGVRYFELDGDH
ncbi:hypothetical protein ACFYOF_16590 [Streptomyces sp. NPDC007148]|uniref:hypothetical protein n=1 Tax=Streptomyces sp. NPDC007148 TaxID=3364775 RepID=UPI0036C00705